MKKFSCVLVFLSLSLFLNSGVEAAEFKSHGDVVFTSLFHQRPSSLRDSTAFQTLSGYLGWTGILSERLQLEIEVSSGRVREPLTGQHLLLIEKAYLSYQLEPHVGVEVGLIGNSWIQMMEFENPLDWMLSPVLQSSWMRLRSDSRSDQGFRLHWHWLDSDLRLSLVNGEGQLSDEIGPKKDLLLHYQKEQEVPGNQLLTWAIAWGEGAYDNVEASVSVRRRILAFVSWSWDLDSKISLELLQSFDSADALHNRGWDRVDLLAEGGQVVKGQGGSIEYERDLSEVLSLNVRIDKFEPVAGVDAKGLTTRMLGLHYFPETELQISLAWVDVEYKSQHLMSSRDISQWILSARTQW